MDLASILLGAFMIKDEESNIYSNFLFSKIQKTLGSVYLLALVLISVIQLNQSVSSKTRLNDTISKNDISDYHFHDQHLKKIVKK
jgi:hypothetical protein